MKALLVRIETYEQLEVVLALAQQPERAWRLDEVVERTQLVPERAQEAFEQLISSGLIGQGSEQGWQLPDAQTREVARQLLAAYQENVLSVVLELTENAMERVRTAALRAFTDPFAGKKGS